MMYTYERLCHLCRNNDNEGDIAHYILKNIDHLDKITVSKIVNDTGISKASIHRFYHKGGYVNFKDFISTLNDEIKQKQLLNVNYDKYKKHMITCFQKVNFSNIQIQLLAESIKNASKVVFYGNTLEISCMQSLLLYLYTHQIDVIYLDIWDIENAYQTLCLLKENDVFIMIESLWRIQLIYENSITKSHMLNLQKVNDYSFKKFYIGEADCDEYLTFHNVALSHCYDYMSYLSLHLLDQKLKSIL